MSDFKFSHKIARVSPIIGQIKHQHSKVHKTEETQEHPSHKLKRMKRQLPPVSSQKYVISDVSWRAVPATAHN